MNGKLNSYCFVIGMQTPYPNGYKGCPNGEDATEK